MGCLRFFQNQLPTKGADPGHGNRAVGLHTLVAEGRRRKMGSFNYCLRPKWSAVSICINWHQLCVCCWREVKKATKACVVFVCVSFFFAVWKQAAEVKHKDMWVRLKLCQNRGLPKIVCLCFPFGFPFDPPHRGYTHVSTVNI